MHRLNLLPGLFLFVIWGSDSLGATLQCDDLFKSASKSDIYQMAAKKAGLVYITEFPKGISKNEALSRFEGLKIPRNYKKIWFSPLAKSHIQATAEDSTGKTQYFYHPKWIEVRNHLKFERLKAFGEALPAIRRQINKDISRKGLDKRRALAALITLLDQTGIRIGDQENAEKNRTYGLTTFTRKHFVYEDGKYLLRFVGKADKKHEILVNDERVIAVLEDGLKAPGSRLFKYLDGDGNVHYLTASDVNEHLRALSGIEISAKDFRTWIGTVSAVEFLYRERHEDDEDLIGHAAEYAAKKLGNTKDVALESYIDPQIFNALKQARPFDNAFRKSNGDPEAAVLLIIH